MKLDEDEYVDMDVVVTLVYGSPKKKTRKQRKPISTDDDSEQNVDSRASGRSGGR